MDKLKEATISAFEKALIKGDKAGCSIILRDLMKSKTDYKAIYEQLLKPSMYEVGDLWEKHQLSVATEHMAVAIVENLLSEMYLYMKPDKLTGKKAVIACVPGEYHQIGVKMVSDLLENKGWESYFLGANVPVKDLISFASGIQPTLIAISMSLHFNLPSLVDMINQLRVQFPETPILVGGQGFRKGGNEISASYKNLYFAADLYELEEYLNNEKQ